MSAVVGDQPGVGHIKIKVTGPADNQELMYKVKMTTRLGKVKADYCSKFNLKPGVLRFLFDGARFSDDDTPQSINMQPAEYEDDENIPTIEVYSEKKGGSGGDRSCE